ncbi:hypothetical protein HanRHA438_Chr15g0691341 [Helianthus annuus]|nr:hypothetical protein HanIR_Chr15g0737801 [Helianthus annuus]KAJ0843438.1 hypothetical protein HanRHA438_Chr15g0691341 [Helianthus annuus]
MSFTPSFRGATKHQFTGSALIGSEPLTHSDLLFIQHFLIQMLPNSPLVFYISL